MDTTELSRLGGPGGFSTLARGHVWGGEKHPQAAPTTFTERVYVILPGGSSEHLYGPCKWLAGHGTTKPQPGAECVVGFDEQNQPVVVWWEGAQTEPTLTGTAGGDLEGTYPNPTIAAEKVTEADIKKEAVSAVKIGPEAVTGTKVNKEVPKVTGSYTAQTTRAETTEFEPSATRPTLVLIQAAFNFGKGSSITVEVGGVICTGANFGTETNAEFKAIPMSFLVPAAVKWKWTGLGVKEVKSSYLIL